MNMADSVKTFWEHEFYSSSFDEMGIFTSDNNQKQQIKVQSPYRAESTDSIKTKAVVSTEGQAAPRKRKASAIAAAETTSSTGAKPPAKRAKKLPPAPLFVATAAATSEIEQAVKIIDSGCGDVGTLQQKQNARSSSSSKEIMSTAASVPSTDLRPLSECAENLKELSCSTANDYLNMKSMLDIHRQFLSDLKKMSGLEPGVVAQITQLISGIVSNLSIKIDACLCQVCKRTPDQVTMRLKGEHCEHFFCCESCCPDYFNMFLEMQKHMYCLYCRLPGFVFHQEK